MPQIMSWHSKTISQFFLFNIVMIRPLRVKLMGKKIPRIEGLSTAWYYNF